MLSLSGGFLVGIIVSEIIGIIVFLWLDRAVEIRYLPISFAAAGMLIALVLDFRYQSKKE